MKARTIRIGVRPYVGRTNAVIQRAVDRLAEEGGGTVVLPAGTFRMRDALHLRSNISVVGQGPKTILRKVPSVCSRIADYLGYGHYEVTVEAPELFRPGMGVMVRDDSRGGFDMTVGTVQSVDGRCVFIDKMLNYDYHPDKNGRLASVFPIVTAEYADNVSVSRLRIDGNRDRQMLGGCRGGGVFFLQTHTATVEDVEIIRFNGDGVSFQQCTDILVRACHIHGLTENGLHPGSGSVRYLLEDNHVHDCRGVGIFYCLRTTHSLCVGNRVIHNGRGGISIGERDTDHIVRGNEIRDNGWAGIHFRDVHAHGGDRVIVEGNRLKGNCRERDEAEVVISPRIREVVLRDNAFCHVRKRAVAVGKGAEKIALAAGNTVDGRALARKDVADASGCVRWGDPRRPLRVGPAAATAKTSRHLATELPRRPANFDIEE